MDFILILFYLSFFIYGIYTSYTDFKFGKIRNFSVLLAILAGLILNIYFSFNYPLHLQKKYFLFYFLNILITSFFVIGIYIINIWTAGDAKLIIGYAFLMSPALFSNNYYTHFTFYSVLMNLFILSFVLLIIQILYKSSFNDILDSIKPFLSINSFLNLLLMSLSFKFILTPLGLFLNKFLGFQIDSMNYIILTIIFLFILNKIFDENVMKVLMFVGLVSLIFDYKNFLSKDYIIDYLLIMITIALVRIIFIKLGKKAFSKIVPVKSLRKNMVLAGNLYYDKQKSQLHIDYEIENDIFSNMLEGKPSDQYKNMKKLSSKIDEEVLSMIENSSFDKMKVLEQIPFAHFVFFSFIVTVILKGGLIIFIL